MTIPQSLHFAAVLFRWTDAMCFAKLLTSSGRPHTVPSCSQRQRFLTPLEQSAQPVVWMCAALRWRFTPATLPLSSRTLHPAHLH